MESLVRGYKASNDIKCSWCDHSWEDHGDGKSPCFWVELDENSFGVSEFCNCEWFTIKMTFNKNK